MSKLARPGFSKLKPPLFVQPRQSTIIVTPTGEENYNAQESGSPPPSQLSSNGSRPPSNKSEKVAPPAVQPKLTSKPVSKTLSAKTNVNRNQQHGTGPYERTVKHTTTSIPYVGKKRPAGVLKSPDSRASAIHKHPTNGTAKLQSEDAIKDNKVLRDRDAIPCSKSSSSDGQNGGCGIIPRALKRTSFPPGKSTGCGDLTKADIPPNLPSRRQTISTGTPSKSNNNLTSNDSSNTTSRLSFQKTSMGVRPRSSCTNNDNTTKKVDSKRNMSKSLQSLPKALPDGNRPQPPMNKPLSKKELGQKSVSTDNLLRCSKTYGRKKPLTGVIPRSKTGLPKFGFSRTVSEKASVGALRGSNNTVSTPQHSHEETAQKKFDHQISPIVGTPSTPRAQNLQETFNKTVDEQEKYEGIRCKDNNATYGSHSSLCESVNTKQGIDNDDVGSGGGGGGSSDGGDGDGGGGDLTDTKQINIIINLDSMSTSEPINTAIAATTTETEQIRLGNLDTDESSLDNECDVGSNMTTNCHIVHKTYDEMSEQSEVVMNCSFDQGQVKNRTFDASLTASGVDGNIMNKTQTIETHHNRTFEKRNSDIRCDDLNKTRILDSSDAQHSNESQEKDVEELLAMERCQNDSIGVLNTTQTLNNAGALIDKTHCLHNSGILNKIDRSLDNSKIPNRTVFVEDRSMNETRTVTTNDSLDKSDSGFDDTTNFLNMSPNWACPVAMSPMNETKSSSVSDIRDSSMNSDLSEDVLKVIAAISSNINRSSTTHTFSQSPIKGEETNLKAPHKSDFMYHLSKDLNTTTNWLDDSAHLPGPELEDTLHTCASLSQPSSPHYVDDYRPYNDENFICNSGSVFDMTSVDSVGKLVFENEEDINKEYNTCPLSQELEAYSNSRYETDDLISKSTTIDISEVISTKHFNDFECEASQSTDASQSIKKYHSHLSSIGTDSEESGGNDMPTIMIPSTTKQSAEKINAPDEGLVEKCCSNHCGDTEEAKHFKDIGLHHSSLKKVSVGSEENDPVLCDSGHCTDMNDNDVNFVSKLTLNNAATNLFPSDVLVDYREKTEPNESASSESLCPSTPLSRQESLEYDTPKRCMVSGSTPISGRSKRVMRSRTYSTSELTTKFRIPKEPKCAETTGGDILMDKTTFLHFMNEVKLVKTSLLKLKRTLMEAPCASPLVFSPLKRSISTIETSAMPPLSPRTCQCSPMAVVNPQFRNGNRSAVKEKELNLCMSAEDNCQHKQKELLEENKLLRSLQENCELKQQDIMEENILLREEISHLTQRLQKVNQYENNMERLCGSVEEIELSADLDSRLPILQRMYSNDGQ